MQEIIKKTVELKKDKYYEVHLSIINPVLPVHLTEMEIKVLAAFMALEGDIAGDRFGTTARKIVREKLNIKFAGLSNYMKSLQEKGFIRQVNNNFVILPMIQPHSTTQHYQFKLVSI